MSEKRDVGVYLEDILESIERIEKNTKNLSRDDFSGSIDKQDAVVHRLEIIGEAAKNVPQEFRDTYPEIPWREIARTRDKITHHYFEIDVEQIWNILQNDLPLLKKQVKTMLQELNSKPSSF